MANAHPLLPTLGAVVGALLLVASLESVHAGGRKLLCSDMQNGVCCDTGACDGPDGSRFTGTMTVNGVKSYCYSNGQCYDNLQSGASNGSAPSTPAIDRLPADYWGSLKPFWGASPSPSASARSPSIPSIPSNWSVFGAPSSGTSCSGMMTNGACYTCPNNHFGSIITTASGMTCTCPDGSPCAAS